MRLVGLKLDQFIKKQWPFAIALALFAGSPFALVWASPPAIVRAQIARILTDYNNITSSTEIASLVARLRSVMAQSTGDRDVALNELRARARQFSRAQGLDAALARGAFVLLNKVHFQWPAQEGLDVHLSMVRGNTNLSEDLVVFSNEHPEVIPRLVQSDIWENQQQRNSLIESLRHSTVANMRDHWQRALRQMGYLRTLETNMLVSDSLAAPFANTVPWVRQMVIQMLQGPNARTLGIDEGVSRWLLHRTDGQPLHSDLQNIMARQPNGVNLSSLLLRESVSSPMLRGQLLRRLRANPAEITGQVQQYIEAHGGNDAKHLVEQVGSVLLPALQGRGRIDLVTQFGGALRQRLATTNAGLRDFFAEGLVHRNEPHALDLIFLFQGLFLNSDPLYRPNHGLARADVQNALIEHFHGTNAGATSVARRMLEIIAKNYPAESFSPALIEFALTYLRSEYSTDAYDISLPLLRRAVVRYPRVRDEVLETLRRYQADPATLGGGHAAQILQGYYHVMPEVQQAAANTQGMPLGLNFDDWVRTHGLPEGQQLARFREGDVRLQFTAEPVPLLLSGPEPSRSLGGTSYQVNDANLARMVERPLMPPTSRNERALVSLLQTEDLATHMASGLPSLTALFVDAESTRSKPLYRVFSEANSITGMERIIEARRGHQRRNEALEAAANQNSGFTLDPLQSINHSYLQFQNPHNLQAPRSSSQIQIPPNIQRRLEVQARGQFISEHMNSSHISAEAAHALINIEPYVRRYRQILNHAEELYRHQTRGAQDPPAQRLNLWRERQREALRASLRRSLATIIREGQGRLVIQTDRFLPEVSGLETNGRSQGTDHHRLTLADIDHIDITWDGAASTPDQAPTLTYRGQHIAADHFKYLPALPPEVHPDAVSVYMMTTPEARNTHGAALSMNDVVHETLFRRGLPLLLRHHAECARILDPQFTEVSDIGFQINQQLRLHENMRPLRWLPPNHQAESATVVEAFLWNRALGRSLPLGGIYWSDRERQARAQGPPAVNLDQLERTGAFDQGNQTTAHTADSASATDAVPAIHSGLVSLERAATNSVPTGDVLHHVDYHGRILSAEQPEHFTLGEQSDFLNGLETRIIEIPTQAEPSVWNRLIDQGPSRITVRSQESWGGGAHAADALLPRPEGWDLAGIEVTSAEGRQLTPGRDYVVLRHGPTGEYAVRLRNEAITRFHVNATYQQPAGGITAATAPTADPHYEVARLRPLIARLREAGFEVAARHLDHVLATRSENGGRQIRGRLLEAALRDSALYTYRPESTLPGGPRGRRQNEFTPWARFLGEDSFMCAQCDGTNGLWSTFLESYHEGDASVRVQPRSEFNVAAGATALTADRLHMRTHELRLHGAEPAERVVYDVTPLRHDPRSPVLEFPRPTLGQRAQSLRNRWVQWWRRFRNTIVQNRRARQLAGTGEPVPELLAPIQTEAELPNTTAEATAATLHRDHAIAAERTPLDLSSTVIAEHRRTLTREIANARSFIQGFGGISHFDNRDYVVLSERLARAYRDAIAGEATLAETVATLRNIRPELVLPDNPEPTPLRQAFAEVAGYILTQIHRPLPPMPASYDHYNQPNIQRLHSTLGALLAPLIAPNATSTAEPCVLHVLREQLNH